MIPTKQRRNLLRALYLLIAPPGVPPYKTSAAFGRAWKLSGQRTYQPHKPLGAFLREQTLLQLLDRPPALAENVINSATLAAALGVQTDAEFPVARYFQIYTERVEVGLTPEWASRGASEACFSEWSGRPPAWLARAAKIPRGREVSARPVNEALREWLEKMKNDPSLREAREKYLARHKPHRLQGSQPPSLTRSRAPARQYDSQSTSPLAAGVLQAQQVPVPLQRWSDTQEQYARQVLQTQGLPVETQAQPNSLNPA